MNEQLSAAAWATTRGDKWSSKRDGMEAMFRPVDEPLIAALELVAPCAIAEVGCGGGATAVEILQRAPAGTVVHGFDISPKLIELARAGSAQDERALAFEVADMAVAAPPRSYERLVSRFGVMFFDDESTAFANLQRWLAPGGRFAFAVWGLASENGWFANAHDVVASVVTVPQPAPGGPGPFRYQVPETLIAVLDRRGFVQLNVQTWRGSLAVGGGLSPADAAEFALASFSSFGELLAEAGDRARDVARRALTARYEEHRQDGVVRTNASVHIVTGARP